MPQNIRDFPAAVLAHHDIVAHTADAFVVSMIRLHPGDVVMALRMMRRRYVKPTMSQADLRRALLAGGLVDTAAELAPHIMSL